MNQFCSNFVTRIPYILATAILGAFLFVWIQVLAGNSKDIATFIGESIAEQGGYGQSFANPIGYTLHFAISMSYSILIGAVFSLNIFPRPLGKRIAIGVPIALGIGWITTLIADPAISITVSLLSGNGWPQKIFPLHTALDLALLNHAVFFLLGFLLIDIMPKIASMTALKLPQSKKLPTSDGLPQGSA